MSTTLAMNFVLPLLRLSSSASSSALRSMRSDNFQMSASRCTGSISGQGPFSKAWRAAATARSMSAALASATELISRPVAGSITGMRFEDLESTHSPPMNSLCVRLRKRAAAAEGSGWGAIEAGEAFTTTYLRTMFSWGLGLAARTALARHLSEVYRTSAHFAAGGGRHTLGDQGV